MTDRPDDSPNVLDRRVRRGAGVRRLNRVPLVIAAIMLLLIAAAVTYTYQMRLAEMQRRAAEAEARPEPASGSDLFTGAPSSGLIEAEVPQEQASPALAPQPADPPTERGAPIPTEDRSDDDRAWAEYQRQRREFAIRRTERLQQAIAAKTEVAGGGRRTARQEAQASARSEQGAETLGQLSALYRSQAAPQTSLLDAEPGEEDINRAVQKRAFLADRAPQAIAQHYLLGGREAPRSPYEVKAGTVVPAIMVGGVNSDLPGQILGQVSENVYDTATGRYILIPQGAKLVGNYDNAVTTGQDRVLIAWTRIIYPDGSSVDLGKMPGADASGFAGFHDKVNTHFREMVQSALMLSVFSAGVQISQGGQSAANGLNAQQTIAAGLGQQLGQLGQELARRNSGIQPTLEIRPGYRFTVLATKDMTLRPWRRP
jgi:type IV secretion system protein VirB10